VAHANLAPPTLGSLQVALLQQVQLHDQLFVNEPLFILGTAMATGGPDHLLVPRTGSHNAGNRDHRLRPHGGNTWLSQVRT
jgi:hypothetical protein